MRTSSRRGSLLLNFICILVSVTVSLFDYVLMSLPQGAMDCSLMCPRPRGYKTFFMLNSTDRDILLLIKAKLLTNKEVSWFKSLGCCIYHANKY